MADVRRARDSDAFDVLFLESARIYTVRSDELVDRLRAAHRDQRPVRIGLASPDAHVIEDVQAQSTPGERK